MATSCKHNSMVENTDAPGRGAWKCADCGHYYDNRTAEPGFVLTIHLGNANMMLKTHVALALEAVAKRLKAEAKADVGSDKKVGGAKIMDANGNSVGEWSYNGRGL